MFDLDGTLTDSAPGIIGCLQHAVDAMGGPTFAEEHLRSFIGTPLDIVLQDLLPAASKEEVLTAVGHYRERFCVTGLFENTLYEGIPEMLATVRASAERVLLVTAKPKPLADRIIEHFELGEFFDVIYGSHFDGTHADKCDLITHVLATEQIDKPTAIMIGDRHHDVAGALKNDVAAIGVLWGYGSREELAEHQPLALIEHPEEICHRVG
jgi:phosphoglycolate phosphatase